MTTTPDEREALATILRDPEFPCAEAEYALADAILAAGFTRQHQRDADHVLISRALLREAADLIKETFGGIDMVRRLREAAGEGEG